jgi:4-amino-4-deoxy-L-arabinose transferase-like glycosyltransferase
VRERLRRVDRVLLIVLAAAFILRVQLASTRGYIHDEDHTSIPLSQTISLAPGHVHLPLRGENHGALPAYVVKASSTLFGTSKLGYRLAHVLLSLLTIVIVYVMTREWLGLGAARWASALLAFNEYYLNVSSRATAHVPHLFFDLLAIAAFAWFLKTSRARYLYAAGAAVGVAFYCKEHAALLLPAFFITLLLAHNRQWLRRPHAYLACALFALVIAPDLVWNAEATPQTAEIDYYHHEVHEQATYAAHLQRVGGLGFSPYPVTFYARTAVKAVYRRTTGGEFEDETPEYESIDPLLGLILLAGVLTTTVRAAAKGELQKFLLVAFWVVFAFFSVIKKGHPPGRLDPVSWMWVEVTIIPAVVLAGAWLAERRGAVRALLWGVTSATLVYACRSPLAAVGRTLFDWAQALVSEVSHMLQVLAMTTVDAVRVRPLFSVGLALAAGVAIGAAIGFLVARRFFVGAPKS